MSDLPSDLDLARALETAVEAASAAGSLLREEFRRPGGPRRVDHDPQHAPVDTEAEELIRARLLGAFPYGFLGEETGEAAGLDPDGTWVVDPNDGTASYLRGLRGATVSIGLVYRGEPVLGVVFAHTWPDDHGELIAWAQGCGPVTLNGVPVDTDLTHETLHPGAVVIVSQDADAAPAANSACVAPGRYRILPSIAHRLARVALGEAVAGVSLMHPRAWDVAAGHALLRAVGGVLLDDQGQPVRYSPTGHLASTSRCTGGAPAAATALAQRPYDHVLRRDGLFPGTHVLARGRTGVGVSNPGLLSRAQGCLLGQLAGDALGGLVEFRSAASIAGAYPDGVRDLQDGGTWNTLAGQPTDDSEMALALARAVVAHGGYNTTAALDAYVAWLHSRPFDRGATTSQALGAVRREAAPEERLATALHSASRTSEANGSLMRVSVLGVLCAGQPERAAACARDDSALTHPHPVCTVACGAYVAAVAVGVAGGTAADMLDAAVAQASGPHGRTEVLDVLRAAGDAPPADFLTHQGWVRVALQNAFYQLSHAPDPEAALVDTVGRGGDTDTNGAIAGALVGALHGREGIPRRWRAALLACRPLVEAGAHRPRPPTYWPVDALDLAEALLVTGGRNTAPEHQTVTDEERANPA